MAPGSEAPSEMLWFIEEKKLIETAEDVTHTFITPIRCVGLKFANRCRGQNILTKLSIYGEIKPRLFSLNITGQLGNDNVVKLL